MILTRRFLPLALILLGAALFYALGAAFLSHAAHADPVAVTTAATDATWAVFTTDGPLWGGLLVAMAILRTFLDKQHWINQGRLLSGLTGLSMVLAAVGAWHFAGAPVSGILTAAFAALTLVTHSTSSAKPAPPAGGSAVALLAVLLLGAGAVAGTSACGEARSRGSASVGAFIDCEAPNLAPLLPDAIALAKAAVMRWISGSGTVDAAGLKSDAAPLKSDLGKCAWDAAIAALATPAAPVKAGAPAASALAINGPALRAAWATDRAELGWAPMKAVQ